MREVLYGLLDEDLSSAEVLRGLRLKMGLSQDQMVELTGIARPKYKWT
jgi:transcriptional regulator with XRE-family HTH domain